MKRLYNVCIAILTTALLMLSVAQVSAVTVTVNAPDYVQKGETFEATIDIDYIENFNAATLYISFDPNVLKVRSVEECVKDGEIGGTKIPVDTCDFIDSGEILVMLMLEEVETTVSGSGYLTKIEFEVVGEEGAESEINIGENSEIVTLVEGEEGTMIPEAVTATFSGATVRVGVPGSSPTPTEEEEEVEEEEVEEEEEQPTPSPTPTPTPTLTPTPTPTTTATPTVTPTHTPLSSPSLTPTPIPPTTPSPPVTATPKIAQQRAPSPTGTPTVAKETQTPLPTPTPQQPTPPGFDAVIAITVLVVSAALLLRRKMEP